MQSVCSVVSTMDQLGLSCVGNVTVFCEKPILRLPVLGPDRCINVQASLPKTPRVAGKPSGNSRGGLRGSLRRRDMYLDLPTGQARSCEQMCFRIHRMQCSNRHVGDLSHRTHQNDANVHILTYKLILKPHHRGIMIRRFRKIHATPHSRGCYSKSRSPGATNRVTPAPSDVPPTAGIVV